ncbi:hypothetical protein BG005_000486 [Podila minutissima]|nr:hypothetical protein BG005_000486 [Podila minutissima]
MHPATYSGGFLGLVVLILDLIAIFEVINSNRSVTAKFLWSLLIFLFPILGLVLYLGYVDYWKKSDVASALNARIWMQGMLLRVQVGKKAGAM